MRFGLLSTLIACLLGFSTPALAKEQAPESTSAKPTKVAVVDLAQLYEKWSESKKTFATIQKLQEKEIEKIAAQQKILKQMQFKLTKLDPKSKEYKKLQDDTAAKSKAIQLLIVKTREKVLLISRNATLNLYRKMMQAVEEIAREKSFDIVMQNDKPNLDSAANPKQLLEAIVNKKVLFANERTDITGAVLKRLEEKTAAEIKTAEK